MKFRLIILLCIIFGITQLFGISDNAGTNGFNFLKIHYSARATGMGSAYAGLADDADGVFYNPAALIQITRKEFSTTYMNYFEGYNGGSFSVVYPYKDNLKFSFFTEFLTTSDIDKTTVDALGNYSGKNGTFGSSDLVLGFGFGYVLKDNINIGINTKFVSETIDTYSASALAFDLAILHQTTNDKVKVGIAIRNIGTQLSYYSDSKYSEGLPTVIDVGFCYRFKKNLLFTLDVIRPLNYDFYGTLGAEYILYKVFALRAGYNSNSSDWKFGGDLEFLSGISLGFGVKKSRYKFDYALSSYGDLGYINQLSLGFIF